MDAGAAGPKGVGDEPEQLDALASCLGLSLFGRDQYDEAIRYLSEAAKANPGEGKIQVDLGAVLISMDRLDEAVSHLAQGSELTPDSC